MKCKCGNDIDVRVGSKLIAKGCKVLTAMTIIITADKCNEMFQVPIKNNSSISKIE